MTWLYYGIMTLRTFLAFSLSLIHFLLAAAFLIFLHLLSSVPLPYFVSATSNPPSPPLNRSRCILFVSTTLSRPLPAIIIARNPSFSSSFLSLGGSEVDTDTYVSYTVVIPKTNFDPSTLPFSRCFFFERPVSIYTRRAVLVLEHMWSRSLMQGPNARVSCPSFSASDNTTYNDQYVPFACGVVIIFRGFL